jgi:hypothetical protein
VRVPGAVRPQGVGGAFEGSFVGAEGVRSGGPDHGEFRRAFDEAHTASAEVSQDPKVPEPIARAELRATRGHGRLKQVLLKATGRRYYRDGAWRQARLDERQLSADHHPGAASSP